MKPKYYKIIRNLIRKNKLNDIKTIIERIGKVRFKLINSSTAYNLSLLEYSLLGDHFEIFEYFTNFIDINENYRGLNESLLTYILLSSKSGELTVDRISLILNHTKDINDDKDGMTALFIAVNNYHQSSDNDSNMALYESIIIELLNHGANPNFLEGDSFSPLEYIVANKILRLMELMVKHAKYDYSKIIFRVIDEGNYDMIELLANNFNINMRDIFDKNPLEYAKMIGSSGDIIELLEAHFE